MKIHFLNWISSLNLILFRGPKKTLPPSFAPVTSRNVGIKL